MKSKLLVQIIKDQREMYFDAMEGCDMPEFDHYGKIHSLLTDLEMAINKMHKECGS